jgi:signal transduction histidine kinase/thioredoxin-like negative regulator of GroEL
MQNLKYFILFLLIGTFSIKTTEAQKDSIKAFHIYQIADKLYKEGHEKEARDTLFTILSNFNSINNDTIESKILALFGYLQKNIGNDTVSINQFMQSLSKKQIKNYLGAIKAMGIYFYNKENYPKALSYFRKLLLFSSNVKEKRSEAEAHFHLGEVFLSKQHKEKAKSYYKVALRYAEKAGIPDLYIKIYNRLGQINRLQENSDSAIYYYTKTIESAKEKLTADNHIIAYENLAKIMEKKGNTQESIAYLKMAIESAKNDMHEYLPELYFELAEIYYNSNQIELSQKNYNLSKKHAIQEKDLQSEIKALKQLGRIELKSGNFSKASKYLNNAILKTDSLSEAISLEELARYEAQYNLMQKEQEIALLDRDKKLNQAELDNQTLKNRIYAGGLIILAILVGFLLYHISTRIKRNKLLSEQNEKINEQNEELNQINNQLSESEQKLIQALSVKNKLFTIIGHDLKSPLMDIKNLIFILKNNSNQFSASDLKGHTAQIENRLTSLLELLNNLLNWGMAEKQTLKYTPEKLSINKLIDNTLKLFEGQISIKNLTIKKQIPNDQYWTTDHNMVEFVCRNIISNAIKFSPKNKPIYIQCNQEEKQLKIAIEDKGLGMDEEQLNKVFIQTSEKIRRGTNNEKGTGLGLNLANDFVKQMNGKLLIESTKEAGTKVTIILPENGLKV